MRSACSGPFGVGVISAAMIVDHPRFSDLFNAACQMSRVRGAKAVLPLRVLIRPGERNRAEVVVVAPLGFELPRAPHLGVSKLPGTGDQANASAEVSYPRLFF